MFSYKTAKINDTVAIIHADKHKICAARLTNTVLVWCGVMLFLL